MSVFMRFLLSFKFQGLSTVSLVYLSILINYRSVDKGFLYFPVERTSFHRAPATLAFNAVGSDGPFLMRIQQHQVGLVSRSDETSPADLEELGRRVTHFLYQLFHRSDPSCTSS